MEKVFIDENAISKMQDPLKSHLKSNWKEIPVTAHRAAL